MDYYDASPSATGDTAAFSAWALSRFGVAIDAYVDRAIRQPQTLNSGAQYGMDDRGNLYQLGQTSNQVVAQVQPNALGGNSLLLIGIIVIAVVLGSK